MNNEEMVAKFDEVSRLLEDVEFVICGEIGEDYLSSHLTKLAKVLEIDCIYVAEQKDNQLITHSLFTFGEIKENIQYDIHTSPCNHILNNSEKENVLNVLQEYPEFLYAKENEFYHYIGYPLIGSLGIPIGVMVLLNKALIQNEKRNEKIMRLFLQRTAEEIERKQVEEVLLQSSQDIDNFSTSLKEIHRLNSTSFENIEDLLIDYLQTGCRLFQLSLGIFSQIEKNEFKVKTVFDPHDLIKPGMDFALVDTYCYATSLDTKAVFINQISESSSLQNAEFFSKYNFDKYLGSPIFVNGKVVGTLSFYSVGFDSPEIEEHYTEVIELMTKSISSEMERRYALELINKIRLQQDGDYFLTSLLLKPLKILRVNSDYFHVEFFEKQKKEFRFKHWKDEIGGDLCTARSILIRDKKYVIFLNADAMGKSMQGAGGALVIGSVFESIIRRHEMFKANQDTYPEAWLKNVFLELHKVFESFDGSMLVSVVLGLLEEETGLLFFMNAEHPWLVLYRDRVATFIKNEHTFYKLGVSITKGVMAVDTFTLLPGDIVIAGTDGRDDIEIFIDSKKKVMNEDETKFLKHVEEGNGNLRNIYESILNSGNLSDDLSLVRIAYVKPKDSLSDELILQRVDELKRNAKSKIFDKNFPEAIQYLKEANSLNPKDNKPLINLIRIYVYQKEYSKAILYSEKYLALNPDYFKILYLLSYSNFKIGNLKNAIEYSERLRGRKPHLVKNLILLVKLYLLKPDKERANKISQELLSLDSNHKSI